MTEDHPYEYKDFSGVIPEGNYGAGLMEIWDKGTYSLPENNSKEEIESSMRTQLKKGHISLILKGEKTEGNYYLIRTPREKAENAWLLINRDEKKQKKPDPFPNDLSPMLAKLVDKPFNDKNWLFEIKWDGFRALAIIRKGKVKLISRNNKSLNDRFPSIVSTLEEDIKEDVIFDGEVVAVDSEGHVSFSLMQLHKKVPKSRLFYYVFDLLYYAGQDLRDWPLIERKEKLELILLSLKKTNVKYSDHILTKGIKLFEEIEKLEIEGILAKKIDGKYIEKRSSNWLKIKTSVLHEAFIGGFTEPKGGRSHFGALLLGRYSGEKLEFIGKVGTGFTSVSMQRLMQKLKPLTIKTPPFEDLPKKYQNATFVKPVLVCNVSFAEWTHEGIMRHPVFKGLKTDSEEEL